MIMNPFPIHSTLVAGIILCFLCLIVSPGSAADIDMEGYLGETITLHGFSYVGDSVYLFLTGPGLPENGVTLTNTDLRADQGQFTVVGVDDNQEWTYSLEDLPDCKRDRLRDVHRVCDKRTCRQSTPRGDKQLQDTPNFFKGFGGLEGIDR